MPRKAGMCLADTGPDCALFPGHCEVLRTTRAESIRTLCSAYLPMEK